MEVVSALIQKQVFVDVSTKMYDVATKKPRLHSGPPLLEQEEEEEEEEETAKRRLCGFLGFLAADVDVWFPWIPRGRHSCTLTITTGQND